MKKLLAVFFALALVGSLWAQTVAVDPTMLDFSRAKLSIAGADSVYIRSIMYNGTELSVLLKYDGADGATVYGPFFANQKLLQDYYELGYARLEKFGDNLLAVYDLVLGNAAYSGRLKWDGGVKLALDSYWQTSLPDTPASQLAAAKEEAAKAKEYKDWGTQLAAELDATKAQLQAQTSRAYAAQNAADKANADLAVAQKAAGLPVTAVAATGAAWTTVFDPAAGAKLKPVTFGTWKATTTALTQSNSSLLFGKYAVPFAQSASNTLYGFTAKAGPTGWVGFGLHFFASGVKRADTYGFGKSYLVWLTRDEAYYRTKRAYVQLYQSSDDVTMVQIASANIGLDLTQPVNTEVVYDKTSRSLEVFVNGSVVISQLVDPIASGDSMAARTLGGGVEFSAFYVKTR
jgi:hypothetical protein